jgi:hypothetical protein
LESIEGLVSVADKRQTHLSILLTWYCLGLGTVCSTVILLWDFIDREVADVNVRRQLWLKRSTNFAKLVPDYSSEEGVPLDGRRTIMGSAIVAETILSVTKEAVFLLAAENSKGIPLTS